MSEYFCQNEDSPIEKGSQAVVSDKQAVGILIWCGTLTLTQLLSDFEFFKSPLIFFQRQRAST